MSLINQMLQDLDKRGSDAIAAEPMYAQTRPVNAPTSRRAWWWVFFPTALLAGTLAWLLLAEFFPKLHSRQTAMPALAKQAVPGALPSAKILAVATAQATPASAPAPNAMPPIADLPLLLKLSPGLENVPVVPVAPPSVTEKVVAPVVIAKVEKISSASAETIEKNKSAQAVPILKLAEPGTTASKFVKEITQQQQAEGEYRQATILQQQGRAAESVLMLEQTLKTDAQHTAARQTLITLLLETKRHDDAMRWLQQWLSADRNLPGMAMILARLQVEKGLIPAAVETLQRSLPHAQDKPDFLAFMAALQQRQSHHKEAADLYREALKRMPQHAVWSMGLAISLQAEGRNQEALDAYRQAKGGNGLSPELLAFVEQKINLLQR
ncbi:MAG: tetratricopeptide repeat protein [Pseudomonadota bacterium]